MTYPDERVVSEIAEHFVAFKVDMLARHPDFKDACAGQKVIWAPTFVIADSKRREIRRWVGWLPAESFQAELGICRSLAAFNSGDFAGARDGFRGVFEGAPKAEVAPEVLYWLGIAGFLAGSKDFETLRESWGRLCREFPESRFATHASVIEDAPR